MISGNGRASNRLVVGRGTDAGSGGSMPHSRFWRGVSRRVRLFAGLGLAVALLATLVALQALPLQAQTTTVTLGRKHAFWGDCGVDQLTIVLRVLRNWFGRHLGTHIHGSDVLYRRWP